MNTIAVDQKVGHWRVVKINGRQATCVCRCGTARILNIDELARRTAALSCGCVAISNEEFQRMQQAEDFARRRREQRNEWKP
jgi:hypothetical protein